MQNDTAPCLIGVKISPDLVADTRRPAIPGVINNVLGGYKYVESDLEEVYPGSIVYLISVACSWVFSGQIRAQVDEIAKKTHAAQDTGARQSRGPVSVYTVCRHAMSHEKLDNGKKLRARLRSGTAQLIRRHFGGSNGFLQYVVLIGQQPTGEVLVQKLAGELVVGVVRPTKAHTQCLDVASIECRV